MGDGQKAKQNMGVSGFCRANREYSDEKRGKSKYLLYFQLVRSGLQFQIEIINTGSVAGDEVVQLYLAHLDIKGGPLRALQGFERIHFERGEKKTVKFFLRDRDLSIVDESGKTPYRFGKD
jgi:hypothetical protein